MDYSIFNIYLPCWGSGHRFSTLNLYAKKEVLSYSSQTRNIVEIFIFTIICLLTHTQQNKQKIKLVSKLRKFAYCSIGPQDPSWCKTQLLRGQQFPHPTSGKGHRPRVQNGGDCILQEAWLQSTHLTRSAGSGSSAVELHLFLDTGVKAEGQEKNHHYRRLTRCRGAQLTGAEASSPASSQFGTDAISGQNKWHHNVAHEERD